MDEATVLGVVQAGPRVLVDGATVPVPFVVAAGSTVSVSDRVQVKARDPYLPEVSEVSQ